jgi:Mn2+/Fe2+ NRAMP family transporter
LKDSKAVIFGPAVMITAAFIGPGTVLTASQAGARFGFSLLWAVVFATLTAIVLQEMAGRLGIATGDGLAQALKRAIESNLLRGSSIALVLVGIFVGNSAFQTGNLLGAGAGMLVVQQTLVMSSPAPSSDSISPRATAAADRGVQSTSQTPVGLLPILVIASVAWALILLGRLDWIQNVLATFVGLMSFAFCAAAIAGRPGLTPILAGLVPRIPPDSGWFIVGLIGTTVVPYNLFLHASAAANRWPADKVRKATDRIKAVQESAKNTIFYVGLGGVITAAILVTAAVAFGPKANGGQASAANLRDVSVVAVQLEPVLGTWAKTLFGLGLFAAGLTSAITAPVAAAYAVAGCAGWPSKLSDWRSKLVATIVLVTGFIFALVFGNSPQDAILMAQVANGFLLPLIAVLLLVMINRVELVTRFHNRPLQNALAIAAIVMVTLIATRQLIMAIPKIRSRLFQPVVASISCDTASPLATDV